MKDRFFSCVSEYHLRVSPSNNHAIAFYKKSGMKQVKSEMDVRMSGII